MVAPAGAHGRRAGSRRRLVSAPRAGEPLAGVLPFRRRALEPGLRPRRSSGGRDPARRRPARSRSARGAGDAAGAFSFSACGGRALRRRSAAAHRGARPLRPVGAPDRRARSVARPRLVHARRRGVVGTLPGARRVALGPGGAARVRGRPGRPLRRSGGSRGVPVIAPAAVAIASPADGLAALATAARASRIAASALRWGAACAVAFAALLAVSVALALGDRSGAPDAALPSASAYLDFDLGVLHALAQRSLAEPESSDLLRGVWARRPAWSLPAHAAERSQLVPVRDAW